MSGCRPRFIAGHGARRLLAEDRNSAGKVFDRFGCPGGLREGRSHALRGHGFKRGIGGPGDFVAGIGGRRGHWWMPGAGSEGLLQGTREISGGQPRLKWFETSMVRRCRQGAGADDGRSSNAIPRREFHDLRRVSAMENAGRGAATPVVRRMSVVYRSVFMPCSVALRPYVGIRHAPPCAVRGTIIGVYRCDMRSLQQTPGGQRRRRSAKGTRRGRMRPPAACCVGCETQGPPGGSDGLFALYESSGDRRRGTRRIGAAATIERRTVRSALRGAVPGEVTAGSAGAPSRVRGEVHRPMTGTATTSVGGGDGSRAKHAAEDAERSEAASAARSAREVDGAAATSVRKRNGPRHPRCFGA